MTAEIILNRQDIKRFGLPADSDLLFMYAKDGSIDDPDLALGVNDIEYQIQHFSK